MRAFVLPPETAATQSDAPACQNRLSSFNNSGISVHSSRQRLSLCRIKVSYCPTNAFSSSVNSDESTAFTTVGNVFSTAERTPLNR